MIHLCKSWKFNILVERRYGKTHVWYKMGTLTLILERLEPCFFFFFIKLPQTLKKKKSFGKTVIKWSFLIHYLWNINCWVCECVILLSQQHVTDFASKRNRISLGFLLPMLFFFFLGGAAVTVSQTSDISFWNWSVPSVECKTAD